MHSGDFPLLSLNIPVSCKSNIFTELISTLHFLFWLKGANFLVRFLNVSESFFFLSIFKLQILIVKLF